MNIKLKFSKMHGLGNDYVMINEYTEEIIPNDKKPSLAKKLCRRGFSVGADGVIFVTPATLSGADVRFRIFNSLHHPLYGWEVFPTMVRPYGFFNG